MNVFELALQLGTVFLGAFLAFWLENLRERQQLRGWANDYLSRIREDLFAEKGVESIEMLEATVSDYATFIAFEPDYLPDEDDWSSLMNLLINLPEDYDALLKSAAVRVLPAELVKALGELSGRKRADETMGDLFRAAWEQYTVPLVLKQETMTNAEKRGLEYVQKLLETRVEQAKKRRELEKQVLELLDKHKLGR